MKCHQVCPCDDTLNLDIMLNTHLKLMYLMTTTMIFMNYNFINCVVTFIPHTSWL